MSDTTHTDTIAEALATWIRVFQEVIQAVGPETAIGFALSIVKRILQKGITPEEYARHRGELYFSILKNRRGPRDRFSVRFDTRTLRIDSKEARRTEESQEACA